VGDAPIIPSIETVEYGRKAITAAVERYEEFSRQAASDGNAEAAKRHRIRANVMRHELLGGEGCVITAFDQRWLNPEFRAATTEIRQQILSEEGDDA
jgi:hypothetical protein